MTDKSRKIPQIRFDGFSEEWELKTLGEQLNVVRSYSLTRDKETSENTGFRYIHYGDIHKKKVNLIESHECLPKIKPGKYDLLQKNDVIVADASEDYNGIAEPSILLINSNEKIVAGLHTIALRPTNINALCLYYLLHTNEFKKFGGRVGTGMKVFGITGKNLLKFEVDLPGIEEQQKIGTIFKQLDETIALHQSEYELLVKTKQSYLQKMFPKKGESVPEIRFAGFTEEWEKRKLEDISTKVTEKNKDKEFVETLTNSAEYGIINQRDFFDKDISNEKNLAGYYIVRENDFVYNPRISNYAPVGPIKRNKLGRTGVMSPLYYVFRIIDIDKIYLEYYFSGTGWHKFMKLNGDSGARADRFAIKDSIFKTMPIPCPTLEEQTKIGNFFKQLDDTITLQQKELSELKDMKKRLLQLMFV